MSNNFTIKQTLVALLLGVLIITSCLQKSTDSGTKEQAFSTTQLYPNGVQPPSNEADRVTISGTIAEIDFQGGAFVVRTNNGNLVLKFDPEHMGGSERERFKKAVISGNQIEFEGVRLDTAIYTLLTAKITAQ